MKTQNNQRGQIVLLATIAAIFLLGAFDSAFAQKGAGAKFGARDPRTCADTKSPAKGAISAAQAGKYIVCDIEQVSGDSNLLSLVEDLTVDVGGGVPYNAKTFPYENIDTKALVYPLRASFKEYSCSHLSDDNTGKNCTIYNIQKATGKCFKTTFGDWYCHVDGSFLGVAKKDYDMPPPGGAATAAAPAKDKSAAKDDKRTAETKAATNENKDENGRPKPDFSAMEKYFEIVRYEYNIDDGNLYIVAKVLKDTNLCGWTLDFYDADGVKVDQSNFMGAGCLTDVGETQKIRASLPRESQMKQVKKVVVTKKIY